MKNCTNITRLPGPTVFGLALLAGAVAFSGWGTLPLLARDRPDDGNDRGAYSRDDYEKKRDKEKDERNKKLQKEVDQLKLQMALQQLGQAIKQRKDEKKRQKELDEQRDRDREQDRAMFEDPKRPRDDARYYDPGRYPENRHEVVYGRVERDLDGPMFSISSNGRYYRVTLRGLEEPRALSPDDDVRVEGYSDGGDFFAYELDILKDR